MMPIFEKLLISFSSLKLDSDTTCFCISAIGLEALGELRGEFSKNLAIAVDNFYLIND